MALSPFIITANKYEKPIRNALIKAWNELRTQESRAAIVKALNTEGIEGVLRLFETIEPKLAAHLSPVIDQALGAGAALPVQMLPTAGILNPDAVVSLYNTETVGYLEQYKLNLIQQIGSNTRDAIRNSLIQDSLDGINPVSTARNFRNTLGLTANQEQSVRNYRSYLENLDKDALQRKLRDKRFDRTIERAILEDNPLSKEQIEKMTNRYRERYIKYRSETIARTEALRATSIGNRMALDQMVANADVDTNNIRRFWHTSGDERVRSSHSMIPGLNSKGIRLDEYYDTPLGPLKYPRDPDGNSANTIQCRCVETYRYIIDAEARANKPVATAVKPKAKPKKKPTPKVPKTLKPTKAMLDYEQKIKGNDFESGMLIDKNGKHITTNKGNAQRVQWKRDDLVKAKGGILTHNHPGAVSFSEGDCQVLAEFKLSEIRAVSHHKRYGDVIYSAKLKGKKIPSREDIKSTFDIAIEKAKEEVLPRFYAKEIDAVETNFLASNRMLEIFAEKNKSWFVYKREIKK